MIKIIDNFLAKTYYKNILMLLTSSNFEWWYQDNMSAPADPNSTTFNEYGFSHWFWHPDRGPNDRFSDYFQPLLFQTLDATNCDFILRARADMVTWSREEFIHSAHIDFPFPNTAAVFYVNESDGDTIFYNVKQTKEHLKIYDRVSPKANRLVLFDGDLLHTGCSPTKHRRRMLINSNYIKKEYKET